MQAHLFTHVKSRGMVFLLMLPKYYLFKFRWVCWEFISEILFNS